MDFLSCRPIVRAGITNALYVGLGLVVLVKIADRHIVDTTFQTLAPAYDPHHEQHQAYFKTAKDGIQLDDFNNRGERIIYFLHGRDRGYHTQVDTCYMIAGNEGIKTNYQGTFLGRGYSDNLSNNPAKNSIGMDTIKKDLDEIYATQKAPYQVSDKLRNDLKYTYDITLGCTFLP